MNIRILRFLLVLSLVLTACSTSTPPEEHEDLDAFMETFSECARIYRVHSEDAEMLSDELQQVDFPENWKEMVDSLTVFYSGDLGFWIETFNEISARSRR
jgi:outer membrane biogenesis lipoprotein LolB